jgi:hypothetical protein
VAGVGIGEVVPSDWGFSLCESETEQAANKSSKKKKQPKTNLPLLIFLNILNLLYLYFYSKLKSRF